MMTDKIRALLEDLRNGSYKKQRTNDGRLNIDGIIGDDEYMGCFKRVMERERPILYENDSFGFNHSVNEVIQGYGGGGNIIPNYGKIINDGFDKTADLIRSSMTKTHDESKLKYGEDMLESIRLCTEASDKYRDFALKNGNTRLYNTLCRIPRQGAQTFYEALVFMKLCIFCLRNCLLHHLCPGRFDVYMYTFYKYDKDNGASDEQLLELLEEFYISISRDADLYVGVQQGDNGQSMVLGGFDAEGNSMYNGLSELCMKASLELCIIEPKINLRVGKNTPDELYEFATQLTKKGLGFPQYCNDDVVVPGLIKLGYAPEDAQNYAVAACWEYIIPNNGADIPNIFVMDFPKVVAEAVDKELMSCDSFDAFLEKINDAVLEKCDKMIERFNGARFNSRPLASVFMDGCIESLTDLWHGGTKYYNYGCHGTGIANAADALCAIKKCVYEDKTVTKQQLLSALKADFEGYDEVRSLVRSCPKMGCNDDYVDELGNFLMKSFSQNLNNRPNGTGGIWRAGTGSAMEYILKGRECPATADGRKSGDAYSSSFSPSLDVKPSGLLSVISSFTKFDMTEIINGGPLTVEIHDSVLRNDIGIKKTAMLVKAFVDMGGHQLQLNSLNRETLTDAKQHPEKYPNLIVRVWGWSGYFNELDADYQNHIIRRVQYLG